MLTISAHKIHGPNGIGAIYIRKGLKAEQRFFGGQQEMGMRSGTENPAAIAGFAKAAQQKFSRMAETKKHIAALKEYLIQKLKKEIGRAQSRNCQKEYSLHLITHLCTQLYYYIIASL